MYNLRNTKSYVYGMAIDWHCYYIHGRGGAGEPEPEPLSVSSQQGLRPA